MDLKPLNHSEFNLHQVCRLLEAEFLCVDTNREVGRLRKRLRPERQLEFRRQRALPKPVLEYQQGLIEKAHVVTVYQVLRPIAKTLDWTKQRQMWNRLRQSTIGLPGKTISS